MSQRLYIGKADPGEWDCVITEVEKVEVQLFDKWIELDRGFSWGPLKIRIADRELFLLVEPFIARVLNYVDKQYPECITAFYEGDRVLRGPTGEQLNKWMEED